MGRTAPWNFFVSIFPSFAQLGSTLSKRVRSLRMDDGLDDIYTHAMAKSKRKRDKALRINLSLEFYQKKLAFNVLLFVLEELIGAKKKKYLTQELLVD